MQVKVIDGDKETTYKGFCIAQEAIAECKYVVLVRQEDVIGTYGIYCQSFPADLGRYLDDSDIPYRYIGIFQKVPNKQVYSCENCGSTNIAIEAVVIQGSNGELDVTNVCDKGHTCNDCGSENVL